MLCALSLIFKYMTVCFFVLQPGIAASVVYRDQVIFSKGFGVKDKTKPDAPDGNTIFRIGSVSKVFAVSSRVIFYRTITK